MKPPKLPRLMKVNFAVEASDSGIKDELWTKNYQRLVIAGPHLHHNATGSLTLLIQNQNNDGSRKYLKEKKKQIINQLKQQKIQQDILERTSSGSLKTWRHKAPLQQQKIVYSHQNSSRKEYIVEFKRSTRDLPHPTKVNKFKSNNKKSVESMKKINKKLHVRSLRQQFPLQPNNLQTTSLEQTLSQLPAITKEVCPSEYLSAKCGHKDEVIYVTQAQYGRMRVNRCVRGFYNYVGCWNDVTSYIGNRCTGRRKCRMYVAEAGLHRMNRCLKDLNAYLMVRYVCVQGSWVVHLGFICLKCFILLWG